MSNDTVTVACKHPSGLSLRLFEMRPVVEAIPGGTREVMMAHLVDHPPVKINGYAAEAGKMPTSGAELAMGYALTAGVPAEFFDKWLKQNATHDLVVNGLIFAASSVGSVKAQTRENEKRWDGLQPMEQRGDTRMSKRERDRLEPANSKAA